MQPFYEAIGRRPLVRSRLELDAPSSTTGLDWDEVQRAIRDGLDQLGDDIRAREPGVRVRSGVSRGGVVQQFVFSTFALPERAEAIVAGVTVRREAEGFVLTADICGEDSGHIYLGEDSQRITAEPGRNVFGAAVQLAARLSRRADAVLEAVRQAAEV